MGRSAGTGSPVWFHCGAARRTRWHERQYTVTLTGRTRPYKSPKGSCIGSRSVFTSYEYRCDSCGHVGWSNHMDLAEQAMDAEAFEKRGYSSRGAQLRAKGASDGQVDDRKPEADLKP